MDQALNDVTWLYIYTRGLYDQTLNDVTWLYIYTRGLYGSS